MMAGAFLQNEAEVDIQDVKNALAMNAERARELAREDFQACRDESDLLEHSIKLVEQHCSKYLMMFGECIQKYPHTWQMDCELERRKLAKCAEHNPEIVHIKSSCSDQFHVYEKCMADSPANPEKCVESFNAFSSCADHALKAFAYNVSNESPGTVTPTPASKTDTTDTATPSAASKASTSSKSSTKK